VSTERIRKLGAHAVLAASLLAAPVAADATAPVPGIPIDEVAVGMHGYGLSVFAGTEPERFEVEVLGVLRNSQPGESFIMARLSGQDLEKTGIIAGMSGSPVYFGDRLAGAVAFTWPFGEEAIAGITPIATMRGIDDAAFSSAAAGPPDRLPATTWQELLSPEPGRDRFAEQLDRLAESVGGDGRVAALWSATGFGEGARTRLGAVLPNLAPLSGRSVAAVGGGAGGVDPRADSAALAPGASVAAVYVDGDLRLAATGTVTDREGDGVLAFGHSVTGLGDVRVPLATSEVITVFPSALNSFKVANSGRIVGAFERDHPAGVAGRIGAEARMIPVHLEIAGERGRSFDYRVAEMPPLLPILVAVGMYGAWDSTLGFGPAKSVDLDLAIELAGRETLEISQSFDGGTAASRTLGYLLSVLDFLARREMGPVSIEGVRIGLESSSEPRAAQVVGVRPGRPQASPGEEIELQVELRAWDGSLSRRTERVRLPRELDEGRYTLLVGDGASIDAARLALAPAPPATLDQVLELLASLRSTRELAILGTVPASGLAVSGDLLPRLPGSMRSIWGLAGARSATPVRNALLQHETRPSDRPLAGVVRVDLDIRRERKGGR
jgi:hypothetical protein